MLKKNLPVLFFSICISTNICFAQDVAKNNTIKQAQVVTNLPPDPCEFLLNEDEAIKMEGYYDQLFDTDGLNKEFWMSKCLVKALADFLNANPTYDGINFSLGASRKFLGKFNSRLIIVSTTESNPQTARKKHNDEWGKQITLPTGCNLGDNIFINEGLDNSKKWINKFGENFRGETILGDRTTAKKNLLSISVWMKACKLKAINKALQTNNDLDGLTVRAACYYKSDDMFLNHERQYEIQTTLIFIPTIKRQIDWKALASFGLVDKKKKADEVYNHGSLCPQICD